VLVVSTFVFAGGRYLALVRRKLLIYCYILSFVIIVFYTLVIFLMFNLDYITYIYILLLEHCAPRKSEVQYIGFVFIIGAFFHILIQGKANFVVYCIPADVRVNMHMSL